jgi:hypothetical protein
MSRSRQNRPGHHYGVRDTKCVLCARLYREADTIDGICIYCAWDAIPQVGLECPVCWRVLYPLTPFPVGQKSALCAGHYHWLLTQLNSWYSQQGKDTHNVNTRPRP